MGEASRKPGIAHLPTDSFEFGGDGGPSAASDSLEEYDFANIGSPADSDELLIDGLDGLPARAATPEIPDIPEREVERIAEEFLRQWTLLAESGENQVLAVQLSRFAAPSERETNPDWLDTIEVIAHNPNLDAANLRSLFLHYYDVPEVLLMAVQHPLAGTDFFKNADFSSDVLMAIAALTELPEETMAMLIASYGGDYEIISMLLKRKDCYAYMFHNWDQNVDALAVVAATFEIGPRHTLPSARKAGKRDFMALVAEQIGISDAAVDFLRKYYEIDDEVMANLVLNEGIQEKTRKEILLCSLDNIGFCINLLRQPDLPDEIRAVVLTRFYS